MISQSYLAATRIGLSEHLKSHTGVQWDYFKSLILPEEGAKGGIIITNTRLPQGINHTRMTHEAQLQLMLSHPDHQEAQGLLCDWGEHLVTLMRELSKDGIHGLHRGLQLEGAMAGCRLTDGIKYYVQDSDQRQDIPEGIALGTLQATYEFIYESGVQLEY